ncbi:hypothetical protein SPBRAN_1148 [uncultured Candidatus Thioglobus sp.]|nr:hypothetical protein SPBRAN_1148 [uncultured Candidatus Thioglobus sp.]
MVYSDYTKQRILSLYWRDYTISEIVEYLQLEDHIQTTRQGVRQFLKRYKLSKSIGRKPGSGMPPKLSPELQKFIEDTMRSNDETTATQLQAMLASMNIYVSLATIVRNRADLGWTYRGSAYCQLIRQPNKVKRLAWAHAHINDQFCNVIWSDESTVQIETHKRYCYRKVGQQPRLKSRPKHPTKVHVWAGISKKGATKVCIFEGIMDAPLYCEMEKNSVAIHT